MKVLVPLDLHTCEGDCPFWEITQNSKQTVCTFDWNMQIIPEMSGIPDFCPLRKFEVK